MATTVPFMGELYQNRLVDPVWMDYDRDDLKNAFARGWIYQETANTQLKAGRVKVSTATPCQTPPPPPSPPPRSRSPPPRQAYLRKHQRNKEALELLFVRRGATSAVNAWP